MGYARSGRVTPGLGCPSRVLLAGLGALAGFRDPPRGVQK